MSWLRKILRRDGQDDVMESGKAVALVGENPSYAEVIDRSGTGRMRSRNKRVKANKFKKDGTARKERVYLSRDYLIKVHMLRYCENSAQEIADKYGVHVSTIHSILTGRSHPQIKEQFQTCLTLLTEEE